MTPGSGFSKSAGRWQRAWQRSTLQRGLVARLLRPLALCYGLLVALRRWLYAAGWWRIERLPVPVIVVGNVVVGGAGKTPTVLALLQHLQARGWRPGVVSRGHGRNTSKVLAVLHDTPADLCGDEPLLIRRRNGIPVFVGRRRAEAARALLDRHREVNLLLCDDGLQHLALGRDVSVAVFDDREIGNGWLLPAGLLREPWPPRGAARWVPDLLLRQRREASADAAGVPTPCHPEQPATAEPARTLWPADRPLFSASRRLADHAIGLDGTRLPLSALLGQPASAVAGIARPEVFFDMLRARGFRLRHTVPLPDHAPPAAFNQALQAAGGGLLLCTEKDAVKLLHAPGSAASEAAGNCWSVPLELHIEPGFFSALDRLLPLPPTR